MVFLQISANFKTGRSRPVGQNWRAKTAFLLGVLHFLAVAKKTAFLTPKTLDSSGIFAKFLQLKDRSAAAEAVLIAILII